MRYNALGLIEVKGYLGAVAAADAALKAAGVNCIGLEVIKGGLVTVKLSGEVGAVQAAVEAGAEIATQLDVLLTRHVIPRLHEETVALVASPVNASASKEQLAEGTADPLAADVKLAAVAATLEAGEIKPDADAGKAITDTIKQAADTSKPSGRTGNMHGPEADTVVALEQAKTRPASRGKAKDSRLESAPAVKRGKNTKKASS
ncbi:BMC domain-containing protein [Paenibacillus sp. N3/727]|uniref:BMC domain-containing protein n=1 Tax=Paenibacillus sp. N3/727 TaxID=2925845 RepID=UPI001F53955F|nr:BMC domain-containing protein [Paenibacillus sp. N3/727]UNK20764.1 BMC domain-containing protein [Paenibacillus sp. N3/727]